VGKHGPQPKVTPYLKIGEERAHRVLLRQKIGTGKQRCYWCDRLLYWNGNGINKLCVDHLDGDTWNNKRKNLVAACRRCNSTRTKRTDFLTHCHNGHRFTPRNTYQRPDGKGRQCRTCNRKREQRRIR